MNKKELILHCFSEMDIQMLEMLLEDNCLYDGADKITFLEKMTDLFEKFKSNKDDKLILYKGKSTSKLCEYCNETGYALVGNNSKKHTDFIFIESVDDILGIKYCGHFKLDDQQMLLQKKIPFDSVLELEFMIPFFDTLEKSDKPRACKKALNSLEKHNSYMSYDDCVEWLSEYFPLSLFVSKLSINNDHIMMFQRLYAEFNRLVYGVLYEEESMDAMAEFEGIDCTNEDEMLKWLLKYEDMYHEVHFSYIERKDYEATDENNPEYFKDDYLIPDKIKFSNSCDIEVESSQMVNVYKFVINYAKNYWPALKKISTQVPVIVNDPTFEYSLAYFTRIKGISE